MNAPTPRTDAAWNSDVDGSELEIVSKQLERELAESQAEVEELGQQKRNCLEIIDDDAKEKAELQAEVERLRSQLAQAPEIADTACRYLDTGGWNEDELYSGKNGWVTETEINEVCASLIDLKSEITKPAKSENT